jgi:hypothetical protein
MEFSPYEYEITNYCILVEDSNRKLDVLRCGGFIYCNVLGFCSRWNFIALQKGKTLQLNTASNSSNTRTRPTWTVLEH